MNHNKFRKAFLLVLLPIFALTMGLFIQGCSDDDEVDVVTKASILLTHKLQARVIGEDVGSFVCYTYNANGIRNYGPVSAVRSNQILLQAVPVTATSISIYYYNTDKKMIGLYHQPLELAVGEVTEITDPAWEDIDKLTNLEGVYLSPDESRVHTGEKASFRCFAVWQEEGKKYPQEHTYIGSWSSSNTSVAQPYTEEKDGETVDTTPGSFETLTQGKSTITCNLFGKSDTADLDVTDATISSIELKKTNIDYPFSRDYMFNELYATWSDGEVTDVTSRANWTSENNNILEAWSGALRAVELVNDPVKVTVSIRKDNSDEKSESLTASFTVNIVEATLDSIFVTLDPEEIFVGESSDIVTFGRYKLADGKFIEDVELTDDEVAYSLDPTTSKVASLDAEYAYLEGLAKGTVDVVATLVNGAKLKASETLTVKDPLD